MYLIARELVKFGWRVLYVSGSIVERSLDEGIELVPFRPKRFREVQYLAKVLRENRVDLCYQRGRKLYSCYVSKACRICSVPYINAFSMDLDFRRHKFLFRNMDTGKNVVKHLCFFPWHLYVDLCSLRAIKKADRVFFQSKRQEERGKVIAGSKGLIINNMHDVPEIIERDNSRPKILWLATIKEWKQPELFFKLVEDLSKENCDFVIAGNITKEKYFSAIKKLEASCSCFKYMPCSTLHRSNALIRDADIFVNTSRREEGFPNTFIQSWLRNTVVISAFVDPNGLLRRGLGRCSGSYEELKRDVVEIVGDKSLRQKIANRAHHYAKREFSIKNIAPKIERAFSDVINGYRRSQL